MDQPSLKNKLWLWFLGFDLLLLNVGIGWGLYSQMRVRETLSATEAIEPRFPSSGCNLECQAYVESKIAQIQADRQVKPSSIPTPTPAPKTVMPLVPKSKVKNTTYLPIPSIGSTGANDWTNLTGTEFYFNLANYTGVVEVRLEANLHLTNGNGIAYIRLYDVTHGIGVQGSDAQTTSQTSTAIESGKITFLSGNNLIRIQAKSLTADTTVFDGGRLR